MRGEAGCAGEAGRALPARKLQITLGERRVEAQEARDQGKSGKNAKITSAKGSGGAAHPASAVSGGPSGNPGARMRTAGRRADGGGRCERRRQRPRGFGFRPQEAGRRPAGEVGVGAGAAGEREAAGRWPLTPPRACEMWTPFLRAVQTRRALRPGRRLPEPAPRSRRRAPVLLPSRCGPSPCLPLAAAGCAPSSPCAVRTPLPPASGPPLRLGLAPVILFPVPGSQRCFPPFRLPPPRALSLPVPRFLVTDRLPSLSPRSACEHFLALPALCEPCLPGFTPAPQSWPLMPRNCFRVVS